MGIGTGMRGKDLQKFLMVARDMKVIILVRHTNDDSLKYVAKKGYYPKPAAVKAKTADKNPPPDTRLVNGRKQVITYEVAGLVVHPGFQPNCYNGAKGAKALDFWDHTMETLSPALMARRSTSRSRTRGPLGCRASRRQRTTVEVARRRRPAVEALRRTAVEKRVNRVELRAWRLRPEGRHRART
jgi:hypothetical protein